VALLLIVDYLSEPLVPKASERKKKFASIFPLDSFQDIYRESSRVREDVQCTANRATKQAAALFHAKTDNAWQKIRHLLFLAE